jgi:hypothetical protein
MKKWGPTLSIVSPGRKWELSAVVVSSYICRKCPEISVAFPFFNMLLSSKLTAWAIILFVHTGMCICWCICSPHLWVPPPRHPKWDIFNVALTERHDLIWHGWVSYFIAVNRNLHLNSVLRDFIWYYTQSDVFVVLLQADCFGASAPNFSYYLVYCWC